MIISNFSVYKLWVVGHPEFYLGVTNSPKKRKARHITEIYTMLRPMKYGKHVSGKHPAYKIFAKNLLKNCSILKIDYPIREKIKFKVLMECDSLQEAKLAETMFLYRHISNPNCLNIDKTSRYAGKALHHSR